MVSRRTKSFLPVLAMDRNSGFTNFDDDTRASQKPLLMTVCQKRKVTLPFLMDKILTEYADQAFETARLRRNAVHTTRDWVSAGY